MWTPFALGKRWLSLRQLEFSKRLRKELKKGVTKGPQPQKRDNSEPDSPQTDSDDLSSTIITPEKEYDTEQSHTYNRERSKKLYSIAGDSNSTRREAALPAGASTSPLQETI
ncbi:hypothetical protein ACTXT7_015654 [Hymenolepis weldensis]